MNGYSTRAELVFLYVCFMNVCMFIVNITYRVVLLSIQDGKNSCAATDQGDLTSRELSDPYGMIARAFNDYEGHDKNVTLSYKDLDGVPTPSSPAQAAKAECEAVIKRTVGLDPTDLARRDIQYILHYDHFYC